MDEPHNVQVDLTAIGKKHWIFNGSSHKQRYTHVVNVETGKSISPSDVSLCYLVESPDGELLGLCSFDSSTITYYSMNFQSEKITKRWVATIPELEKFSYPPHIQLHVPEMNPEIMLCLIYGGKGIFLYALNINRGFEIWKKSLHVERKDFQNFGHFDVAVSMLIRNQRIACIVTLKGCGFYSVVVDIKTGNCNIIDCTTWQEWENENEQHTREQISRGNNNCSVQ